MSHHLLLLQTIAFISIQMEHKDTSQRKFQIKLHILWLLGNLLLNKHCSTFRAFQMPIELVGNLRLHRKLNASSQVFFFGLFKHCQNLCILTYNSRSWMKCTVWHTCLLDGSQIFGTCNFCVTLFGSSFFNFWPSQDSASRWRVLTET
jgi:hypothetical protein